MECRPLEITVVSASDLKNDNFFSKMDVYAAVSISGDSHNKKQKTKTPVSKYGGTNPEWNSYSIKFTVDDAALLHNRLTLNIKLVYERSLGDNKIGKVQIPLKELFDSMDSSDDQKKQIKHVSYSVPTSSGKPEGSINFGYKFGDKFTVSVPEAHKKTNELVMAYPSGHPGSSSRNLHAGHAGPYPPAQAYPYNPPGGYAPPPHQQPGYGYAPQHHQQWGHGYAPPHHLQPGHGYAPPHHQQPGYGYAPPHHPHPGYGYAPPPQAGYGYRPQPGYGRAGGNMALDVEAGLWGGLLIGGMLGGVGEMAAGVGEVAANDDGYDAGYDAGSGGFDDGYDAGFSGGFDDGYDAGFSGGFDF